MSQRNGTFDDELNEEIATHMRMAIEERVARGESRELAERAVRREFGNVTQVKEVTRELRLGVWLEQLRQDLRYGATSLLRTPAFTMVAVFIIALAIGANSAVFTLVNSVLLRPLPFHNPQELYHALYVPPNLPHPPGSGMADELYLTYHQRAHAFAKLSAYQRARVTLTGTGDAARILGARVTEDFFNVLGVQPALGRSFAATEEASGGNHVVILGEQLWRQRYSADTLIVGKSVTIDGVAHTVIGIAPARFTFPASAELWMPLPIELSPGNSFIFGVVGRLRAGITALQAATELDAIAKSMPHNARDNHTTPVTAQITPLKDTLTSRVQKSFLIFAGAVGFVLLIACVNVANLLLIRASTRRHEMAVRVALGASRVRIARQLLTESILIGGIGGIAGILMAYAGVRALIAMAPEGRIPRLEEVTMDGWVLGCTLAVALVTGIVFGIVPALVGSRGEPHEALSHGMRTVVASQSRLRGTLVSAEIALALVLLTGAGLMVKSFVRMRTIDMGYQAEGVVSMAVDLPAAGYPDAERIHRFHDAMIEQLSRIPGARKVGAASYRPMSNMGIVGDFFVDGATPLPEGFSVDKPTVSPGYFDAMGIRMLQGRDFTRADHGSAQGVVIVSETVAQKVWPEQSAIGKRISMRSKARPEDWLTVVGVVNDVVQDGALTKHSTIYLPYLQTKSLFFIDHMTYVVRSAPGVRNVASAMRSALRSVDATVPAQELQSMDDAMLSTIAEPLFQTRLLTTFSLLALVLAVVGTYGVLAYDVAERKREISLRMALGATPGDVMRMVLRRTALLAATGAILGVAGSLALSGVLTKSLFDVKPSDPLTMLVAVLVIVASAMTAGYLPARQATRMQALSVLPRS